MNMEIIVIAHNIRSTHNVGSIFRTADGFGVNKVYLTGYSPYPRQNHDDTRLPHLSNKIHKDIHKTALGAEDSVDFEYRQDIMPLIEDLRRDGFIIVGLEQDVRSKSLFTYLPPQKIALLLGEEVNGITDELRKNIDEIIEIPMFGQKESFNVSVSAGIALFRLRQATDSTSVL